MFEWMKSKHKSLYVKLTLKDTDSTYAYTSIIKEHNMISLKCSMFYLHAEKK